MVVFLKTCTLNFILIVLISSCSAPRNIYHSGKVTPQGHFRAGGNYNYNIPSATIIAVGDQLINSASLFTEDSVVYDDDIERTLEALTIYSIDPIGSNFDLYARYGIYKNFDVGLGWSKGAFLADIKYQFLGSTGTIGNPEKKRFYGSLDLQYSTQSFKLPTFLGEIQTVLDYKLNRKDLLIPLVFSYSFGPEETYGAIGFGLSYGRSWINYSHNSGTIYQEVENVLTEVNMLPNGKTSYSSYGIFTNLKLGYKYVYLIGGASIFYQNYGTYSFYEGHEMKFKGVTIVPFLGIEIDY